MPQDDLTAAPSHAGSALIRHKHAYALPCGMVPGKVASISYVTLSTYSCESGDAKRCQQWAMATDGRACIEHMTKQYLIQTCICRALNGSACSSQAYTSMIHYHH